MPKKATKKLRLAQRNRREAKRMTPSQPPASLLPSPEPVAKPNEIAAWVNRLRGELGRDRTIMQMQYEPSIWHGGLEGIIFAQEVATKPTFWARLWRWAKYSKGERNAKID